MGSGDDVAARLRVALVTHAGLPELAPDDRLVLPAFAARGAEVSVVAWDDPSVAWDGFDVALIRSTWNYTERHDDFLGWLDRMEEEGVPLWNPPALARWNATKRYLRELEEAGVAVVPTRWVEPGEEAPLAALLAEEGWDGAVVKPVVSANARDTWTTSRAAAAEDERRFRALVARGAVMVQPFVEEVRTEGEWSLLFFGGALSHTLVKRPASGDFRVQEPYGGTAASATPDNETVAAARAALAAVPHPWLYARVDGVRIGGRFHVMELEMLEPSLFLATDPDGAPGRLADAVIAAAGEVAGV